MAEPGVPGAGESSLTLPCGETISAREVDMGMRDLRCGCGADHAVVTDVHPPSRFVPETLVEQLRATTETADDFGEFGTPHLLGMVREEFPEDVVSTDVSEDGAVGYALLWVADFDSRRLHEVVVELVVEMMEHAVSHAEDPGASREFEAQMQAFDVAEFVERYRAQRDFQDEHDDPA
jgi:hypothetical protein